MTKRNLPQKKAARQRVLGRQVFAAISAVEGLKLTVEGMQRTGRDASLERRRDDVLSAYRQPKAKK
jgi:hypothetical protein